MRCGRYGARVLENGWTSTLTDRLPLIAALAAAAVGMLVWIPVLAGCVAADAAREHLSSVLDA